jgi:hypothetical protein
VKSKSEAHSRTGEFRKVGENLYRYSSNGIYYARFCGKGKSIYRSLKTTDRELAKRQLKDEIGKASKIDPKLAKMTLDELLRFHEETLAQYTPKTTATRQSILKIFKETWEHGLDLPVKNISTGLLEMWLAARRASFKNATYNEYARFLRHVFGLAVKLRVLATSPAAELKGVKLETPLRLTPPGNSFKRSLPTSARRSLVMTRRTRLSLTSSWAWPASALLNAQI